MMASLSFVSGLILFLVFNHTCTPQRIEKNSGGSGNPIPRLGDDGIPVLDKSQFAPFDTDIRNDCRDLLEYCQSDIYGHVYLQCPGLCTKFLEEEGFTGNAKDNADALYEAGELRTYQTGGRAGTVDSDRFEGYVLVFAVVPLLPGMAVYYYEMMAYLHAVFEFKVEFVLLPVDHDLGIHLKTREKENGKVVVLAEESVHTFTETHPWVKHLASIKPVTGRGTKKGFGDDGETIIQRQLQTDRVSIYIVSADGYYVEQLIAPTMKKLKERIRLFTKSIDYGEL
mmetsp:Transcript_494/g.1046  ORF Transcript_494/g.1046 Transcript_494/m.1046 type:complete len:283 (+) Transcript_494:63-911(+)